MVWTISLRNIMVAFLLVLALSSAALGARDAVESEKIEFLIASVEKLTAEKFVRNGTEYDGKEAAKHLRKKLKRAAGRVRRAEDFITYIGSGSSLSGKPYLIKFPDGRTLETGKYLRDKLKEYDATRKNK